jgi:hypothetical protein
MKLLVLKYGQEYIVAMGDTIDCVPLINEIAGKEKILLPVMLKNYNTIRSFWRNDSNVNLHLLKSFNDYNELRRQYETIEIIGMNDNTVNWELDIETVYKAARLNYAEREKYCHLKERVKEIPQLPFPNKPYAFIPEGGSPGTFKIDRQYVGKGLLEIVPPQDAMMLSYARIIEHATEIHCHATSWPRLIDKLPTKDKLFMHHYVRDVAHVPPHKFPMIKNWTRLL